MKSIDNCPHCDEPIDGPYEQMLHLDSDGTTRWRRWHRECRMRSVIGGLNHLMKRCTCCGGTDPPDPPEMTRREAARAACEFYAWHR